MLEQRQEPLVAGMTDRFQIFDPSFKADILKTSYDHLKLILNSYGAQLYMDNSKLPYSPCK
jgi:hypothetical protein